MENQHADQENSLLDDFYFKSSYKGQNYKILQEYKNWKKLMIEKYGKNGKEITCPKDNTIIYKIHNDNGETICPTCKLVIYNCIFCNKISKNKTNNCCSKAYIKFADEEIYNFLFTDLKTDENILDDYILLIVCSFIPFISPFPLLCKIINSLIIDLDDEFTPSIFYSLLTPFALIMSAIYGILYYVIFISFFILSIPFKLYPLKIYFGILIVKPKKIYE